MNVQFAKIFLLLKVTTFLNWEIHSSPYFFPLLSAFAGSQSSVWDESSLTEQLVTKSLLYTSPAQTAGNTAERRKSSWLPGDSGIF